MTKQTERAALDDAADILLSRQRLLTNNFTPEGRRAFYCLTSAIAYIVEKAVEIERGEVVSNGDD